MTKLVVTTETKVILKKCVENRSDFMIFITDDDIVFSTLSISYYSVRSMKMIYSIPDKRVCFYKKCLYSYHSKIRHYSVVDWPMGHFYWNVPKPLCPIYCYGLAVNCKSDTIDEIIRDYSKLEEQQKMLHFHVADVLFHYK